MGNWDWNLQTGNITWSNHLEQLFGLAPNTFEGTYEAFLARIHPEDRDSLRDSFASRVHSSTQCCLETGENCDIEFRIVLPDGSIRWMEDKGQVIYDETGLPVRMIGVSLDISDRKEAEEVKRQTQARLRRLVEANLIGVIFADFSGNITEANDAFLEMVGYTREELGSGKVRSDNMTPPEYAEDDARARAQLSLTGVCTPHEKEYIRKDGSRVAIFTGSALLEGSDQECVSFVVDLTWRKQAEARIRESLREKEVLLQEIHHRVKNNLQVISSLLDLQSQHIEDRATLEVFRESCNRVKSMALVHEKLYESRDCAKIKFAEYVESLTSYLFQAYAGSAENITLELDIDEVTLNINTAIPCGLIISELISNALKYAFPNNRAGGIHVALHSPSDDNFILVVKDTGIGFPINFNLKCVKSLGLQLVNILTNQLEGSLELDRSVGTEFRIRFSETSF
jgi:PAS domain S-box-containing protein